MEKLNNYFTYHKLNSIFYITKFIYHIILQFVLYHIFITNVNNFIKNIIYLFISIFINLNIHHY